MMMVVVLTTAGYCYTCPPPTTGPIVTERLYLIPAEAYAAPGAKMRVRARMITTSGNTLPVDNVASVSWSSPDGLTILSPATAPFVDVQVPTGAALRNYTLVANVSPYPPATLVIHANDGTSPGGLDWLTSTSGGTDLPMYALFDGNNGAWVEDRMIAFVGRAPLDYLTCTTPNCGEITLFGPASGVYRLTGINWKPGCDWRDVSFTDPGGSDPQCSREYRPLPGPRTVNVDIFALSAGGPSSAPTGPSPFAPTIGPPTYGVDLTAEADVTYADEVYSSGLAGLKLNVTIKPWVGPDETSLYVRDDLSCTEGAHGSIRSQLPSWVTIAGGLTITVVYVKNLYNDITHEPYDGYNGFTCPWKATDGTIVVMSWDQWTPTTFAHELGHAIGPWRTSPFGHADMMPPYVLTRQNIMWPGESSATPAPRSIVTLGQAFRLSLDKEALHYRVGAPPPEAVDCTLASAKCSALEKDVKRQ